MSVTINGINARVEKDDDASSNGQVVYTVENRNLTDSDRIEITIGDCTYEEFELVVMEDFGRGERLSRVLTMSAGHMLMTSIRMTSPVWKLLF